jgi:hypothetical protein
MVETGLKQALIQAEEIIVQIDESVVGGEGSQALALVQDKNLRFPPS